MIGRRRYVRQGVDPPGEWVVVVAEWRREKVEREQARCAVQEDLHCVEFDLFFVPLVEGILEIRAVPPVGAADAVIQEVAHDVELDVDWYVTYSMGVEAGG